MTRLVLVLLAVLVGACTPPRPLPDPAAPALAAWRAEQAQQSSLLLTVQMLQTNPYVDPAVRADPWACARAIEAAGNPLSPTGPLPRCYADALVRQQAGTVTAVPVFMIGR